MFVLSSVIGLLACADPPPPNSPAAAPPAPAPAPVVTPATPPTPPAPPTPPTPPAPPPEPIGEPIGSPVSNAPTTSSGIVADAGPVIVALRPKFKQCYETAKGQGPPIVGMVSCGLRVTKQGKVAAISVTRRDRLPNPLVDCLIGTLKTATFQPLDEEAVIQVPIRFAGGD